MARKGRKPRKGGSKGAVQQAETSATGTPQASPEGDDPFHDVAHVKKRAFLGAFSECGNVERAAEAAGISRRIHYYWIADDEEYAKKFEKAQRFAATLLEDEARRRATEGVHRLKFHEGQVIMVEAEVDDPENPGKKKTIKVPYIEHEYSDTLLIFLLKGNAPEKFRERVDVKSDGKMEHSGSVTTHIIPAPVIGKLGDAPQGRG